MSSRPVYSTQDGRLCPRCGRSKAGCSCPRKPGTPPADGVVRVGRQTKGRKGKGVTLVTGVALEGAALTELARELKGLCGSGGTVKAGVIEIQGDHRDRLVEALEARGYRVKRAGG